MSTKVIMPQMGESIVEGKVSKWLVKEGDPIERDQPIVEVSTDKVDVEIPAPGAGRLEKILVREGETVQVGTEIALIGDGKGAAPAPPRPEAKKEAPAPAPTREQERALRGRLPPAPPAEGATQAPSKEAPSEKRETGRVSPLVKRLAEQYRVDLSQISGTGIEGRITKQDLLRHLGKEEIGDEGPGARGQGPEKTGERKQSIEGEAPPALPEEGATRAPIMRAPPQAGAPPQEFTEYKPQPYEPKEGDRVVPFSRLRKMIAEHMVYSKRTAPHVTTVAEVDMMKAVRLREEKKEGVKRQTGEELTFLPFILSAAVQAIADHPALNASVVGQSLVIKKEIHMGIAVETEKGLMVPVIRRAHEKSLTGLARAAAELARKAREGTLTPEEVTGGTFTVSNPGRKGNLFGTPIIFQPQVGILRMGEIVKRPVVVEVEGADTVTIHPMMYLALSYDHRVIDGATGNLYLHRVKEILEEGRFSF